MGRLGPPDLPGAIPGLAEPPAEPPGGPPPGAPAAPPAAAADMAITVLIWVWSVPGKLASRAGTVSRGSLTAMRIGRAGT